MKRSTQVRFIGHLEAMVADLLWGLKKRIERLTSSQDGEVKVAIEDLVFQEETQETLALLKLLALGSQAVDKARVRQVKEAVGRVPGPEDHGDRLRGPFQCRGGAGQPGHRRDLQVLAPTDVRAGADCSPLGGKWSPFQSGKRPWKGWRASAFLSADRLCSARNR